ncbi:MAG: AbrB/MazE/SpoVT family DNA-binding domain-containing protein [Roseitalea porphyridii]|jgi:antitoxin PrlF|uniref:AbrB/MazE/SpoVT family DNA-binding domain-containing protein n=1 Tax=Roseitalea porphyridii TaxID=1852022 RepID=UPI0032EBD6D1
MAVLTVTAKGQITLKKEVLQHLGVKPGDKVDVSLKEDGVALVSARNEHAEIESFMPGMTEGTPKRGISKFAGSLKSDDGIKLTIEEIKEAAERAWAGER